MVLAATLSKQIGDVLIERIVSGQLRPGDRLVEGRLVEEFGTSQSPVREALLMLEHQGYVTRTARRGTLVRKYTPQEVTDLYDVRYLLEEYAARKALQIAPIDLSSELAATVRAMESLVNYTSTAELRLYQQLNDQFHSAFFTAANNHALSESYARVYSPLMALRRMSLSMDNNLRRSFDEHCEMADAAQQGDADRVVAVLERHHSRSVATLLRIISG